jgi:C-terminal processing protease CtpA/Prc
MLLELYVATALQAGVSFNHGTVGIVGFRQSSFNYSVLAVHPGSPADGVLRVGDKVLAIDGDTNRHDATGEPGTSVVLTVKRGDKVFDATFQRVPVQDLHSDYLCRYFNVKE